MKHKISVTTEPIGLYSSPVMVFGYFLGGGGTQPIFLKTWVVKGNLPSLEASRGEAASIFILQLTCNHAYYQLRASHQP